MLNEHAGYFSGIFHKSRITLRLDNYNYAWICKNVQRYNLILGERYSLFNGVIS
jgi:hypothetical protein